MLVRKENSHPAQIIETSLSCVVELEMSPEHLDGVQKAIWWAEWQANA